ncbi:DUF2243 domain-containing protein [Piscinibacter koreensis]|uniref:DUF2243 domain-containing protein n=1 Tax=Piscinibacter koreensis TaxID=2742824 RepID=A0A7Y6NS34_9BURK|nr:DUF2243 domain-containing protein [Schlegelella koreensis]NUZ08295.1 DUF2243 domain-containing protein [Schlegelella koreensis]
MSSTSTPTPTATRWPALLLGVAIGGFFDGILLHQILQWHHLLSNVDAVRDMRTQVLADGLFHALMYLIAAGALVALWRRRRVLDAPGVGRSLWAQALIGFGLWHVVDALLSHWITGIHRIRVDSPDPLLWDLAWFAVFGVLPMVLGWLAVRRGDTGSSAGGRRAATALAFAAVVAGPVAALPTGDGDQVMVLFAPGVSPVAAFDALARVDARVRWVDRSGGLWAVSMKEPRAAWRLYGSGALLVSNSAVALGCFSWSKAL